MERFVSKVMCRVGTLLIFSRNLMISYYSVICKTFCHLKDTSKQNAFKLFAENFADRI